MTQKCTTCGKDRSPQERGSLTQWMFDDRTCDCNRRQEIDSPKVEGVCRVCGHPRGADNMGSITQWIFKRCKCNLDDASIEQASDPDVVEKSAEAPREEIEVKIAGFPIDRYKPLAELGKGASGAVFLCYDTILEKQVALKVLQELGPEQMISFQNEARATSSLDHPNVVKIFDLGITDGDLPYMVMEHIDGMSLRDLLARNTLSETMARSLISQLCLAVAAAHSKNILHRDIKPSNILVSNPESAEASVHLIDFGIAKLMETTAVKDPQGVTLAGTPFYMPPDMVLYNRYDERSEIYAIGCVLFEALAGEPPFAGETPMETIGQHAQAKPPNLLDVIDVSPHMAQIVSLCLEKDPSRRFQSCDALYSSLCEKSNSDTLKDEQKESKRFVVGLVVSIAVLFLSFFGWKSWQNHSSDQSARKSIDSTRSRPLSSVFSKSEEYGFTSYAPTVGITDSDLAMLSSVDDLQRLYLENAPIDGTGLSDIPQENLKVLVLSGTRLSDEGFRNLGNLKGLGALIICRVPLDQKRISVLRGLKNLEVLHADDCGLTDSGLAEICRIATLKSLHISGNTLLTSEGFKNLDRLGRLTYLTLSATNVGADDLLALKNLKDNKLELLAHCCERLDETQLKLLKSKRPGWTVVKYKELKNDNNPVLELWSNPPEL